jgi:hypothetical protein
LKYLLDLTVKAQTTYFVKYILATPHELIEGCLSRCFLDTDHRDGKAIDSPDDLHDLMHIDWL